ncbi:MAG: DUF177 domain-containing protein [Parvularculaceae bacterium]
MTDFTRKLELEKLSDKRHHFRLRADDDQLSALAKRLKIVGVNALSGYVEVKRGKKLLYVSGEVQASLTRTCVTSLEEMTEDIDETFELKFDPEPMTSTQHGEMEIDLDSPEPLIGGVLDVAGLLVDQVSLAMVDYPRKKGSEALKDTSDQPTLSPFAILKSHNLKGDE